MAHVRKGRASKAARQARAVARLGPAYVKVQRWDDKLNGWIRNTPPALASDPYAPANAEDYA